MEGRSLEIQEDESLDTLFTDENRAYVVISTPGDHLQREINKENPSFTKITNFLFTFS